MECERVNTSSKENDAASVGLKRKKWDGRSFKAFFKTKKIRETTPASVSKQEINKGDTFLQAKQHLQFGCTEDEADTVYRKFPSLKKAFLQRVDRNDISSSSSKCHTTGTSQAIASIQPNVINEMEERLQVNDFSVRHENLFTEVKHRCERRMSKLEKKQKEEIDEFWKKWEKEKGELEEEYKLRLSVLRYTFRCTTPALMDRQKRLKIELSSKLQELKSYKDQHLKEIEGKHSVIKNKEMQKAAAWLAQANSLMGHSAVGDELSSIGSDAIDDMIGCTRENINVSHNSPETVLPVSEQHVEEPNAGNIVDSMQCHTVASDVPACTSDESNILRVILETPITEELVGLTSVDGASAAISKPLNEVGDQEVPASTPNKLDTHPIGTTETPEIEERVEIASTAGASVAKSRQPNEVGDSEESVLDLTLVAAGPDDDDDGSLLQNQSTGLNEITSHEMLLPENQSGLKVEVDAGTCEPNNIEAVLIDKPKQQQPASDGFSLASHGPKGNIMHQNDGDQANSIPNQGSSRCSNEETVVEFLQVSGNLEERPSADFEALPPSCDHPNSSEVNRVDPQPVAEQFAFSQNAETPVQVPDPADETPIQVPGPTAETPVQVQGPTAETPVQVQGPADETLVQCASPPSCDRNSSEVSRGDPQPIAEQCVSSQNAETPLQVLDPPAETSIHVTRCVSSQNAEAPVQVSGPFTETPVLVTVHPAQQMATRNANLSFNADPLHKEWEKMQKEREQATKFHEDMKVHLKSDCEKEIAEICEKYDLKLQEVEAAFRRRRNEIDMFQNKVLLNKMLADAFRDKCMNLKPSGFPGMHQGVPSGYMPSGYMQHLRQVSQQQPHLRSSPATDLSSARQLSLAGQPTPTQLTAAVSRSTPLSAVRPPLINAITPSTGYLRVGGEVRAPAPHLQPFRPPASTNIALSQPLQHHTPINYRLF